MSMIEVKTAELSGAALDWAVAEVEGLDASVASCTPPDCETRYYAYVKSPYKPSRDWWQGGSLIEKYQVSITYHNAPDKTSLATLASTHPAFECGETVLIAACRAIVAAKLGDTVQIPAELLP